MSKQRSTSTKKLLKTLVKQYQNGSMTINEFSISVNRLISKLDKNSLDAELLSLMMHLGDLSHYENKPDLVNIFEEDKRILFSKVEEL